MRWKEIQEAVQESHHSYDDIKWGETEFKPLKAGDTVRVFHGFRDRPHAIEACAYGLSGRQRAQRVYSYESDNNPYGLFVTLNFKTAAEFGGTIIEFVCRSEELEAPVWPGGGYTVQGQMAQYFGHGAKGRAARNQRRKAARAEVEQDFARRPDPENWKHVTGSDDLLTANMLLNSHEYQALFIGDLNPKRIVAVYTRDRDTYNSPYTKLTTEQFLSANPAKKEWGSSVDKIFQPDEPFDGEKFIGGINARYGGAMRKDMEQTLKNIWSSVYASKRRTQTFVQDFGNFMWPNQYRDAIRWMKARWGNGEG